MAAEADAAAGKASNSKAEEKALAAADQKANLTVGRAAAAAADVDECSDDDADPVIRNMNLMSRLNLMTPEWIKNAKEEHYEEIALYNRVYDALQNGEIESDPDDDDDGAAAAERSKGLWASVGLSGLNNVGGESCGMDAVAVYPAFLHAPKSEEEDKNHDAAAAVALYPAVLRPEDKDQDKDHDADAACAESSS